MLGGKRDGREHSGVIEPIFKVIHDEILYLFFDNCFFKHPSSECFGSSSEKWRHKLVTDVRWLVDTGQALISRYLVTRSLPDLDMAMQRLQEYLTDTSYAKGTTDAYMRLAAAYYFKRDYTNAWKYIDQTKALDAAALQSWPLLDELQKSAPR